MRSERAKISIWFTVQSIFLAVMLMMVTLAAHADSVKWRSYSNDVFKAAKASHRMVLLYGFSPRCQYCAMMNSKTFMDSSVVSKVNKNYIPVKVNILSDVSVAKKYNIYMIPTMIILNSNGDIVSSIYGFQEPSELLGKL